MLRMIGKEQRFYTKIYKMNIVAISYQPNCTNYIEAVLSYFPKTKKNRSRRSYAEFNYAYQRRTKVTEFSKTFLVFYKWLNLLHSKVCLVIFLCCEHAAWYLLFLSLFCFTSQQYTSSTKIFIFFTF